MRALLLCVLVAGCAAQPAPIEKTAQVTKERDCPALPTVPRGADRHALLSIIAMQAELYARCAGGE